MSVLYITSFAADMYEATGKKLIASFKYMTTTNTNKLLVCHEGLNEVIPENEHIIKYDLSTNQILVDWLKKYSYLIPIELGGSCNKLIYPKAYTTWNAKASRWFRKVASLKYARDTYGDNYDYIIWIDSDCVFKAPIPIERIRAAFSKRGMFYYFGASRFKRDTGYETGFLGFSKKGYDIIDKFIETYINGSFEKLQRWDDGFVLRCIDTKKNSIDLAYNGSLAPLDGVAPHIFRGFILHHKGYHRKIKIM